MNEKMLKVADEIKKLLEKEGVQIFELKVVEDDALGSYVSLQTKGTKIDA